MFFFLPSLLHDLHEKQPRSIEVIAPCTGVWSSSVSAAGRWNSEQPIRCRLQTFHVRMSVKWRVEEERKSALLSIYVNNSTYARFLWEPTLKVLEVWKWVSHAVGKFYKVKSQNGGKESTSAFCRGFYFKPEQMWSVLIHLKTDCTASSHTRSITRFLTIKSSFKSGGTFFTSLGKREVWREFRFNFVCTVVIFNTLKPHNKCRTLRYR